MNSPHCDGSKRSAAHWSRPLKCRRPNRRGRAARLLAALCAMAASTVATVAPAGVASAAPAPAAVPKPNPHEWWLTGTWHVERDVWPLSQGQGVTVAVIDTGVGGGRYLPPEMTGNFILPGTAIANPGETGNYDTTGHGTLMAELIAARGTNGGFAGLAPAATILPVKIISSANITDAIRWSVDHGAKVISISMGGIAINDCSPQMQAAVDYAIEHEVIIVASAGNSGDKGNATEAPGSCPGVTAVGAVDRSGRPWQSTQRKPYVAVAAPGVDLTLKTKYNELETGSGTSDSTALVSATMALVRAKYPRMPARQVVQRVVATATDAGQPGRDDVTGYGIVNPARALTAATVPASAGNPAYDRWDEIKAAQRHARESRHRRAVLLKAGAIACGFLVVLAPVLLIVWSVRRDRRAKRAGRYGATLPNSSVQQPSTWPPPPVPGPPPPPPPGSPPGSLYGAASPQPPAAPLHADPRQEPR